MLQTQAVLECLIYISNELGGEGDDYQCQSNFSFRL